MSSEWTNDMTLVDVLDKSMASCIGDWLFEDDFMSGREQWSVEEHKVNIHKVAGEFESTHMGCLKWHTTVHSVIECKRIRGYFIARIHSMNCCLAYDSCLVDTLTNHTNPIQDQDRLQSSCQDEVPYSSSKPLDCLSIWQNSAVGFYVNSIHYILTQVQTSHLFWHIARSRQQHYHWPQRGSGAKIETWVDLWWGEIANSYDCQNTDDSRHGNSEVNGHQVIRNMVRVAMGSAAEILSKSLETLIHNGAAKPSFQRYFFPEDLDSVIQIFTRLWEAISVSARLHSWNVPYACNPANGLCLGLPDTEEIRHCYLAEVGPVYLHDLDRFAQDDCKENDNIAAGHILAQELDGSHSEHISKFWLSSCNIC